MLSAPDDVVVVMFEDYEPEDSRTPTVAWRPRRRWAGSILRIASPAHATVLSARMWRLCSRRTTRSCCEAAETFEALGEGKGPVGVVSAVDDDDDEEEEEEEEPVKK